LLEVFFFAIYFYYKHINNCINKYHLIRNNCNKDWSSAEGVRQNKQAFSLRLANEAKAELRKACFLPDFSGKKLPRN
jgi:hypothetical protein